MEFKRRRFLAVFVVLVGILFGYSSGEILKNFSTEEENGAADSKVEEKVSEKSSKDLTKNTEDLAVNWLEKLEVKGRAPKTDYRRAQFGEGWQKIGNCDTRNAILRRDLTDTKINKNCKVLSGVLNDPYTGKTINFVKGEVSSQAVQIDHVVALSNAWQTGAQKLTEEKRIEIANDPLNLLAVDGAANQQKSDGDAATWLPENKNFRCQYVARQIAVKVKYNLWITEAEKSAMNKVLQKCPTQKLPDGWRENSSN